MRTVSAFEPKTHLSRLLDEVAQGETITTTKHGVPVAVLAPAPGAQRPDVAAIEDWRRYREEHNITLGDDVTIRELIEEGRRY